MLAVLSAVGRFLLALLKLIGRGLRRFASWFGPFYRDSFKRAPRATAGITAVVAVLIIGWGAYTADTAQHDGRLFDNVSIGGVQVGGMTEDDAIAAVAGEYETRLRSSGITVYASQEAMDQQAGNAATDDTVSVQQEQSDTNSWQTDANALQASIDYRGLFEQAMQNGRQGPLERFMLRFGTHDVPVTADIDTQAVESLAESIDESLGEPYQNWGVSIDGGAASVTEGHDGNMVDRGWLTDTLSGLLVSDPSTNRAFVATVQYTPVQIGQEAAQWTADRINAAIGNGMDFTYGGSNWNWDVAELGSLIDTAVEQADDGSYELAPHVNGDKMKAAIVNQVRGDAVSAYTVSFEKADDGIYVNLSEPVNLPNAGQAASTLEARLFGDASGDTGAITVEETAVPQRISFDDAVSYGVISQISSYTTEYTARAEARNWNIHLAASTIDGSIAKAGGGTWSFNDTTGNCDEAAGYKQAGVVVGNTTSEDYGGGICQVATTVFNAVYDAGFPVTQRRNHSIYMAGYPAGRDAAVSWPSPDLKWQDDSSSDVLVRMSYTDTTVTCTLWGVDPGYQVSTETGDWQQGETYGTTYEYNDSLPSGQQSVKTNGQNGRSITVTRKVRDASGNLLHTDVFESNYRAQDQVVLVGTA